MEQSFFELPEEILMIILKKLNNYDVLYSLLGVNQKLDALINSSICTKHLTLTSSVHGLHQMTDKILNRFSREILPIVNDKIERLDVLSSSVERIFHTINYPNLNTLGLYELEPEIAKDLLGDGSYLIHMVDQLLSMFIRMKGCAQQTDSYEHQNMVVFGQICALFKNLKYLNFCSTSNYEQLTFGVTLSFNELSSNLSELHVVFDSMADCLYLLDSHFNQLQILFVTVYYFKYDSYSQNRNNLPKLKCFSLIYKQELMMVNEIFDPLLQRILNVEELSLCFISKHDSLIDGNYLKNNIINRMKRLNKFTFNIRSLIRLDDPVNLPSKEDIQNTFQNNQTISSVDYFPRLNLLYCHVYSYPYSWTFYNNITNNFPGGIFKYVREISLHDERPFEDEFFLQIVESFPHVEKLSLNNREPQHNDIHHGLIIKYPYLIELDLVECHQHYVKQFLDHTKTYLTKVNLYVDFKTLKKATDDFKTPSTLENCSSIIGFKVLRLKQEYVSTLKNFFPSARML